MAQYTYDFKEMDAHMSNVEAQLGNEISSLSSQASALETQVSSLQSQLYYVDENGVRQINTAVQSQISVLKSALSQIYTRVAALNKCIGETKALIIYIKNSMEQIDDDYKTALDDIMKRMDTYTQNINEYMKALDDGPLSNNGAILYKPIQEIKDLLDRNGAGVASVSDATIREFQRRVVFDRFLEIDPSISGLSPQDLQNKIDTLIADTANTPGVSAILYYTLQDPNYLKNVNIQDQNVQDIINQVTALQTYLGGNFPIIIGQGKVEVFFGGDQGWWNDSKYLGGIFYDPAKNTGGCGSVAAANILANLALKDPEIAKKLGLGTLNASGVATKTEYLDFMTDVYKTVTPLETPLLGALGGPDSLGIWFQSQLQTGVVQYAFNHGVYLKGTTLDKFFDGPYDVSGLDAALANGDSVVFGNMLTPIQLYDKNGNKVKNNTGDDYKYDRHWVDIVGKDGDKLIISSWGREYYINYSDLKDTWANNLLQGLNSMTYFSEVTELEASLQAFPPVNVVM